MQCQKEDWKAAYHKGECALLKEGKDSRASVTFTTMGGISTTVLSVSMAISAFLMPTRTVFADLRLPVQARTHYSKTQTPTSMSRRWTTVTTTISHTASGPAHTMSLPQLGHVLRPPQVSGTTVSHRLHTHWGRGNRPILDRNVPSQDIGSPRIPT